MTTSLLGDIRTELTPAMVHHLSSLLGESPVNTQKAVDGVLPTLLAGVMHLSSSEDGPPRLVNLISHRNYERLLNNLSGMFDKGNTAKILIASGRDILSAIRWQDECCQCSNCQCRWHYKRFGIVSAQSVLQHP